MYRIRKSFLLKVAAIYYIILFVFVRYLYIGDTQSEQGEIETIRKHMDTLSQLSEYVKGNLTAVQKELINVTYTESDLGNYKNNTSNNGKNNKDIFSKAMKNRSKAVRSIVNISPNGDINVDRAVVVDLLNNSLRRWDEEHEVLAFMHIGKNGGTAFRNGLKGAKHAQGCKLKENMQVSKEMKNVCPGQVPCVCSRHYDWTEIDKLKLRGVPVAPIVLLRDPVKRSISHFFFAKTLSWTKGYDIRSQNISQYLNHTQSMLLTRDVWQDGQAAVSWFSGTHIGSWVVKLTEGDKQTRETISLDWNILLNMALNNFHESIWVGIMEKLEESLELLHYQTGFDVKMGHANANKKKGDPPTANDIEKLKKLMPLDLWFYEYASQIHDIKWELYQQIKMSNFTRSNLVQLVDKMVDNLPKHIAGCTSTRYILSCPDDKFYFQLENADETINIQQRSLLPKTWN